MKVLAPSITAYRTAKTARVLSGVPRPVDASGATPALWGRCVGWEIDEPAAVDATQDLLVAIDEGERSGKLRAQDKTDEAKLKARLTAELAKAKADRESGVKPGRSVKDAPSKQRGK